MGRTERIESASQLLYPRYKSLSDALLVGWCYTYSFPRPKLWPALTLDATNLLLQYPDGAAVPVSPAQFHPGLIFCKPVP